METPLASPEEHGYLKSLFVYLLMIFYCSLDRKIKYMKLKTSSIESSKPKRMQLAQLRDSRRNKAPKTRKRRLVPSEPRARPTKLLQLLSRRAQTQTMEHQRLLLLKGGANLATSSGTVPIAAPLNQFRWGATSARAALTWHETAR